MSPVRRFPYAPPFVWLSLLLGFCLFYFYTGGGPNQGSRIDLCRAILDQHQLAIDGYEKNTIDKAWWKGRTYSDKAPGASFVALPAVALSRGVLAVSGESPDSRSGIRAQVMAATWLAATLPALLACLVLFAFSRQRGDSMGSAVFAALGLGLGTPLWVYATLFWGHALATACLFAGAFLVVRLATDPGFSSTRRAPFLAGLLLGLAVLTEFPTAPPVLGLLWFLLAKQRPWKNHGRALAYLGAGLSVGASLLFGYNTLAFGSPFHLGYASVQGFAGMQTGFFGISLPRATALYGILLGPRGLLYTGPILFLGVLGHLLALRHPDRRPLARLSLGIAGYFVLLNSSYFYWHGGGTYGPRHLCAMFPFLALGLPTLVDALPGRARLICLPLLAAAMVPTLLAVSTHGMPFETVASPLTELHWPQFRDGFFATNHSFTTSGGPATNLGIALGLPMLHSLWPFWAGFLVLSLGLGLSLRGRHP